ncbi:MAG: retron system putative HNH endonuclease [Chloroflexota bacterium]
MKYIEKRNAPAELTRWFAGQKSGRGEYINASYHHLPSSIKQAIHKRLIGEQGALCCYTGRRISKQNSHIEHFLPRSQCHHHEDVEYANLLAAYGTDQAQVPYGAHVKAGWFDHDHLVDPRRKGCESYFKFDKHGRVKPVSSTHDAATVTIQKLNLNHPSLVEMRGQVIKEVLFSKAIGIKQLKRIAETFCLPNKKGHYRPFCFAVTQVAAQSMKSSIRRSKQNRTNNPS